MEEGHSQVRCGLWRVGEEDGPLDNIATLEHSGNFHWLGYYLVSIVLIICCDDCSTAWHPGSTPQLASASESQLVLWKVAEDSVKV